MTITAASSPQHIIPGMSVKGHELEVLSQAGAPKGRRAKRALTGSQGHANVPHPLNNMKGQSSCL